MVNEWIPVSRIDGGQPFKWIKPELVLSVEAGCQCIISYRDGEQIRHGAKPYDFPEEEFRRRLGVPLT